MLLAVRIRRGRGVFLMRMQSALYRSFAYRRRIYVLGSRRALPDVGLAVNLRPAGTVRGGCDSASIHIVANRPSFWHKLVALLGRRGRRFLREPFVLPRYRRAWRSSSIVYSRDVLISTSGFSDVIARLLSLLIFRTRRPLLDMRTPCEDFAGGCRRRGLGRGGLRQSALVVQTTLVILDAEARSCSIAVSQGAHLMRSQSGGDDLRSLRRRLRSSGRRRSRRSRRRNRGRAIVIITVGLHVEIFQRYISNNVRVLLTGVDTVILDLFATDLREILLRRRGDVLAIILAVILAVILAMILAMILAVLLARSNILLRRVIIVLINRLTRYVRDARLIRLELIILVVTCRFRRLSVRIQRQLRAFRDDLRIEGVVVIHSGSVSRSFPDPLLRDSVLVVSRLGGFYSSSSRGIVLIVLRFLPVVLEEFLICVGRRDGFLRGRRRFSSSKRDIRTTSSERFLGRYRRQSLHFRSQRCLYGHFLCVMG